MPRLRSLSLTAVIAAVVSVFAFPELVAADTITLEWDASPDSRVVGYMMYVSGPSGFSRTFDVGDDVLFPFTEAVAGQRYCFAVAAYAAGPSVGQRSAEVCGYSDAPPVLQAPGDRSSGVGQPVNLQLDADDPYGQAITFSVTGLPPGLSLQASTGFISGTPTVVGSYLVTATAFDGLLSSIRTFTWTIVAPDGTAPSITVTSPTSSSSYSTSSSSISLGGSASDNVSVSQVTWVNSRGGSGTASGRTSWSVGSVALQSGSNVITVTARDTAGNQSTDSLTVTYTPPAGPLAISSLTADRTAPQAPGTAITFTATVTGGTAPQQYKWWIYNGSTWSVARNWATSNTWTWTPSSANSAYQVGVWVRNATTSSDMYENSQSNRSIAFAISGSAPAPPPQSPPPPSNPGGQLSLTSLSGDRPSPQAAGTSITFVATATGGNAPYQYKWWIFDGGNWVVMQQWTSSDRWTWTPGGAMANARVAVWIRNAGSNADAYDNANSNGSIPFSILPSSSTPPSTPPPSTPPPTTPPPSSVLTLSSISSNRPAPSVVGTPITFTASATGGRAPYQYKWWIHDGDNWVPMRDWSTTNTWTWVPADVRTYRVAVWVRNAGSTADIYDNSGSSGSVTFPIAAGTAPSAPPPPPPPSTQPSALRLTALVPSQSAPAPAGSGVQFTASSTGGTGPHQYKWWIYNGSTWYAMTGWSTSNTWVWAPPAPNSLLQIAVWVRSANNTTDMYENANSAASIAFPVY